MVCLAKNIEGGFDPDGDTLEKFKKKNYFRLKIIEGCIT